MLFHLIKSLHVAAIVCEDVLLTFDNIHGIGGGLLCKAFKLFLHLQETYADQ